MAKGFLVVAALFCGPACAPAPPAAMIPATAAGPIVAVGPQYDSTHVYVPPDDLDAFVRAFLATFGGESSKQVMATVTPTPSSTTFQFLRTPVGAVSLFGFKTPIPYPFGQERNGYLVTDLDVAVQSARRSGADVLVEPFSDVIGRDAVVVWPGGVAMQLYWHFTKGERPPLETVPENRVYVSSDRVEPFVEAFVGFSHGHVVADDAHAPGVEMGRAGEGYRRVRIESAFGKMVVLVTDGHLPYPYGRETTGYEVANLADTLAKGKSAGATILVEPYLSETREAAMVAFPGGYVAEVHATLR
jgi:hypothetical protein